MEIWESKAPGTLWATLGLLRVSFYLINWETPRNWSWLVLRLIQYCLWLRGINILL